MGESGWFMGVFRRTGLLSAVECLAVRRAMDLGRVEDAEVLQGGAERQAAVRLATIVEPEPPLIGRLEAKFDTCRDAVSAALRLNLDRREGAGFIRYPSGGFYRPHRDRGADPGWPDAARRQAALVLFLNTSREIGRSGDFDGGILRLFLPAGALDVIPEAGLLVAFPADILHEVTEVRHGTRDTVVDWFYGAV
jgi:predicted 2-oxoglutarate/Fe(II)-dependent dioxygenase YbiX